MSDFLLGTVLLVMFFVGIVLIGIREGLFSQELIEELKKWKEVPEEVKNDVRKLKVVLKKFYNWLF
ncbi:MAG: hypothetical protein DRH33_00915 [Candidatus Nealsonbacteria bacterium]|nr:MAG: hypothetical protein DRH33_00915 [Candidatus Nealsonbacteria bacterium]